MTREEWMKLPKRVRLWRTLFCPHPFEESTKIGTVYHPERDVEGLRFVVHVRQCGRCPGYFMDAGLEERKPKP